MKTRGLSILGYNREIDRLEAEIERLRSALERLEAWVEQTNPDAYEKWKATQEALRDE